MNKVTKVMIVSFFTNIFLSSIKIISGFFANSSALVADGIHSFSDLVTDLVAIVGNKISNKPADDDHPYGHGNIEFITSIIISIFILTLGFSIFYNSFNNSKKEFNILVIVISLVTVIGKLILSRYVIKKGKKYNNNILISSGKESSTDVISSIVVLISGVIMYFGKYNDIFLYADKAATIIVSLFIIKIGYQILTENLSNLLGIKEKNEEILKSITEIIESNKLVERIDDLVLLKYGSYYKLIAEVSMDENIKIKDSHNEINNIEKLLKKHNHKIKYIMIHVNPYK